MGLVVRRLKLHLHSPRFDYHLTITPFSTASAQAPPPSPRFCGAEYLIHSCGLPSDEAVRAYNKILQLKSPHKADAVLRFLREVGMSESHIRTAISRNPRLLCCNMDNNLKPNVAKLREAGVSMEDISAIISRCPGTFLLNFAPKVDFWLGVLGSADSLSAAMRRCDSILCMNVEKTILPNLCFLRDHCGFLPSQIVRLVKLEPRIIITNPQNLKLKAQRAEELGFARLSGMFLYALIMIDRLSQHNLDARLNSLKRLGFSQEEVKLIISKVPMLLGVSEKLVSSKMEFLLKEAGCDKNDIVRNPFMLMCSLEKRLIPRNVVRKLLMSKGSPPANCKFASFVILAEKRFVDKYVLPYENAIPGLHSAYADAFVGKIGGIEQF